MAVGAHNVAFLYFRLDSINRVALPDNLSYIQFLFSPHVIKGQDGKVILTAVGTD
jgi:hypothetical protein